MNDIYPGSDWSRLPSGLLAPPDSAAARDTAHPTPAPLYYHESESWAAFTNLATRENLRVQVSDAYITEASHLPFTKLPGQVVWARKSGGEEAAGEALLRFDGVVVLVTFSKGGYGEHVGIHAAGSDFARCEAAVQLVKPLFRKRKETEDPTKVDVKFWTNSVQGPRPVMRTISAPTYDEISDNYAPEAHSVLEHMTSTSFRPGSGGQLILWHGPPGTGKTFALRALAQSWRTWCHTEYVVDPEQFFGDANYLMAVMLDAGDPYGRTRSKARWRLLIFEDTGELLAADARARTGQGLSRLLNVVDGFVGQGLQTMIMITTNEDFEKLHPAVTRPGRCAVKAHFGPLPPKQVAEWGKDHGLSVTGERTLAELFALRDGAFNDESTAISRPIGFSPDVHIAIP